MELMQKVNPTVNLKLIKKSHLFKYNNIDLLCLVRHEDAEILIYPFEMDSRDPYIE